MLFKNCQTKTHYVPINVPIFSEIKLPFSQRKKRKLNRRNTYEMK